MGTLNNIPLGRRNLEPCPSVSILFIIFSGTPLLTSGNAPAFFSLLRVPPYISSLDCRLLGVTHPPPPTTTRTRPPILFQRFNQVQKMTRSCFGFVSFRGASSKGVSPSHTALERLAPSHIHVPSSVLCVPATTLSGRFITRFLRNSSVASIDTTTSAEWPWQEKQKRNRLVYHDFIFYYFFPSLCHSLSYKRR